MLKKGTQEDLKKEKKCNGGATKQSTTATNEDSQAKVPSFDTLKSVIERAKQTFDKGQYAQCLEILFLKGVGGDGCMNERNSQNNDGVF